MTSIVEHTPQYDDGGWSDTPSEGTDTTVQVDVVEHTDLAPVATDMVDQDAEESESADPLLDKYMEFADEHQDLLDQTTWTRTKERAKDAAAIASVVIDSPLAYETLWASTVAGVSETTHSPAATVAAATGLALGAQASSAWGAARILASKTAERINTSPMVERIRNGVHRRLGKLGIEGASEMGLATNTAITFVGGEMAMLGANQFSDPTRTEEQNRRLGWKVAPLTTALALPLNVATAEGLTNGALNMETRIGLPAVVLLGTLAAQHITGRVLRGRREREQAGEATLEQQEWKPNYHLNPEEFDALQAELVDKVKAARAKDKRPEGITSVVLGPHSPYSDLIRTLQVGPNFWPELEELMEPYEDNLQYIALVDTRGDTDRIVHAFCLSNAKLAKGSKGKTSDEDKLSIALLQDVADSGQNLSVKDLREYYKKEGVDLDRCISVESNFRVGKGVPRLDKMGTADLGYLTIFKLASSMNRNPLAKSSIFAHLNKVAKLSLSRSGVEFKPVAGREDLQTPSTSGKMDSLFAPFEIPGSFGNRAKFTLGGIAKRKTLHIINL